MLHLRQIRLKCRTVCLFHRGIPLHLLDCPPELCLGIGCRIRRIASDDLAPNRIPHRNRVIVHQQLFVQPPMVKRVGAHKVVQPMQGLDESAVVPSGGNQLDQIGESAVVLLIVLFDGFLCNILLQHGNLALAAQTEICRNLQQLEIGTNQIQTEGVDGTDVCRRQQGALAHQVGISRILGNQLGQPRLNPLLHLLGGGIGKGHHQNPIGINRMLPVGQDFDDPLNQYRRLAAARRRRHQHGASPTGNCLLLRRSPARLLLDQRIILLCHRLSLPLPL